GVSYRALLPIVVPLWLRKATIARAADVVGADWSSVPDPSPTRRAQHTGHTGGNVARAAASAGRRVHGGAPQRGRRRQRAAVVAALLLVLALAGGLLVAEGGRDARSARVAGSAGAVLRTARSRILAARPAGRGHVAGRRARHVTPGRLAHAGSMQRPQLPIPTAARRPHHRHARHRPAPRSVAPVTQSATTTTMQGATTTSGSVPPVVAPGRQSQPSPAPTVTTITTTTATPPPGMLVP
ncbi:MAG: hypothetical protein ACYDA6_09705, partial [Solirubrobacteraceae bacterium]